MPMEVEPGCRYRERQASRGVSPLWQITLQFSQHMRYTVSTVPSSFGITLHCFLFCLRRVLLLLPQHLQLGKAVFVPFE